MFGKELFIRFTALDFRGCLSRFVCVSFFPFGFEGGLLDLIVLIPDHCLSIYKNELHYKSVFSRTLIYTSVLP